MARRAPPCRGSTLGTRACRGSRSTSARARHAFGWNGCLYRMLQQDNSGSGAFFHFLTAGGQERAGLGGRWMTGGLLAVLHFSRGHARTRPRLESEARLLQAERSTFRLPRDPANRLYCCLRPELEEARMSRPAAVAALRSPMVALARSPPGGPLVTSSLTPIFFIVAAPHPLPRNSSRANLRTLFGCPPAETDFGQRPAAGCHEKRRKHWIFYLSTAPASA